MSEPGTIWGVVVIAYTFVGMYLLSNVDTGPAPKNVLPGSKKKELYRAAEKKAMRHLLIWCVGLVALIATWLAFHDSV